MKLIDKDILKAFPILIGIAGKTDKQLNVPFRIGIRKNVTAVAQIFLLFRYFTNASMSALILALSLNDSSISQ